MKKENIQQLFNQFENICYLYNGIECWSARELQFLLGYSKWDNFVKVIDKAKNASENAEIKISDHFADIGKMVELGSGSVREIPDIALTRYACYLIAQNGDASKHEIAFAQTYFAVQTRKQEHIENNKAVRKMLLERGVKPELLPPSEDVKKVKRKLESEIKHIEKEAKKRQPPR